MSTQKQRRIYTGYILRGVPKAFPMLSVSTSVMVALMLREIEEDSNSIEMKRAEIIAELEPRAKYRDRLSSPVTAALATLVAVGAVERIRTGYYAPTKWGREHYTEFMERELAKRS